MSAYLANWYRDRLNELGYPNITIEVLYHPTLFVDRLWTPNVRLGTSEEITLINIGAWYRNPFTIYSLDLPNVNRKILKGHRMESYFPPEKLRLSSHEIASPETKNRWVYYLSKYLQSEGITEFDLNDDTELSKRIRSVQVVEKLENEEYDHLLTSVSCFLHLVDVSAANTIIECIVRNTPIVVNNHPAVVEYLGDDYPLLYSDPSELKDLLTLEQIEKAHKYLQEKDKSYLTIDRFLSDLTSSDSYKGIYSDI